MIVFGLNFENCLHCRSQKTHPGKVVSVCENPIDENKILIAFSSGFVALWDLKNRTSEQRFHCSSVSYSFTCKLYVACQWLFF